MDGKSQHTGTGYFKTALLIGCIAILGFLLTSSRDRLKQFQQPSQEKEQDLYLPQPEYLKFVSLGNDGLISDILLAKALVYYGSHYRQRETFGFKHLKKLFLSSVKMDPLNVDAFLIAGNILGDVNVKDAIEILQLGMQYHPESWKFPEMIGYQYFFRLNDSYHAAKYYEIAAQKPGHPPYIPSLSGKFYQESGRYEEAIRVLYNFYSTTTDKRLKESFKESIEILKKQIETGDFLLKGKILKVISPVNIEFQPDPGNPLFQSLRSREVLHISDATAFDSNGSDREEQLFARFQQAYATFLLTDKKVKLHFEREANGHLKRDDQSRLYGSIILESDRQYRPLEINIFPPETVSLDLNQMYRSNGKVVSIRFRVKEVEKTAGGVNLYASAESRDRFYIHIPQESLSNFSASGSDSNDFFSHIQEKHIVVNGLALPFNNGTVIEVYQPEQIK